MDQERSYPFISRKIGTWLNPPIQTRERVRALAAIQRLRVTADALLNGQTFPATKMLTVRVLERGLLEHLRFAKCMLEDCLESVSSAPEQVVGLVEKSIRRDHLNAVLQLLNTELDRSRHLTHREVSDLYTSIWNLYIAPGRTGDKRVSIHASRCTIPDRELYVALLVLETLAENGPWCDHYLAQVYCAWQPDSRFRFTLESAERVSLVADYWESVWR